MFVAAFVPPWLLHHEFGRFALMIKRATHLGAPGVVEPHSGSVVVVPLPLCPWYLQGVIMYAESLSYNCARAGVEAALLRVLGTCQVVLVDVAPGAFGRVRTFNGRTRKLP